ncbi:hypothetical protein JW933_05170 [candidate division FCPU426 bacterium]|nr:hypothetical protein [candidate division FCPU426 bacterium]
MKAKTRRPREKKPQPGIVPALKTGTLSGGAAALQKYAWHVRNKEKSRPGKSIAGKEEILRFIQKAGSLEDTDGILRHMLESMHALCAFTAGAVYLHGEKNTGITQEPAMAEGSALLKKYRRVLHLEETIYQWIFQQGQPVAMPGNFRQPQAKAGLRPWSYVIAPLTTGKVCLGHVEMLCPGPGKLRYRPDTGLLEVLLKLTAVFVANVQARARERAAVKKNLELDLLKEDVINTTLHEIKTPLTVIQGASLLMQKKKRLNARERAELLNKVIKHCRSIGNVIEEMLEISRIDENIPPAKAGNVSLADLTYEVLREIPWEENNMLVETRIPPRLAGVQADRHAVYQAIRNLVENAVKYSQPRDKIIVSAGHQGRWVWWRIKDHGPGIAPVDQRHIFEKFYRAGNSTTRKVRGMGFGLYLVRKNIENSGGTIAVASIPGKGTEFLIKLPRSMRRHSNPQK